MFASFCFHTARDRRGTKRAEVRREMKGGENSEGKKRDGRYISINHGTCRPSHTAVHCLLCWFIQTHSSCQSTPFFLWTFQNLSPSPPPSLGIHPLSFCHWIPNNVSAPSKLVHQPSPFLKRSITPEMGFSRGWAAICISWALTSVQPGLLFLKKPSWISKVEALLGNAPIGPAPHGSPPASPLTSLWTG